MSVIESLFSEKRDGSIEKLWGGEEEKKLLLKEASNEIDDYPRIIWSYPNEQIIAIAMKARFACIDESFRVGHIVNELMGETRDLLPKVTKHSGMGLATRCLVSTGFFWDYMETRTKRYGAPSPGFYMDAGRKAFYNSGWENIADNFSKWREFLAEEFSVSSRS
jgi:hypothetical protein